MTGFICGVSDENPDFLSACKDLSKYPGTRYCVLHYPDEKNKEDFLEAKENKLDQKDYDFGGTVFPEGTSDFAGFEFDENANFVGATFNGDARFSRTKFRGKGTYFYHAEFRGKGTYFHDAEFSGEDTDFHNAEFRGQGTYFSEAQFSSESTSFEGTQFSSGEKTDFSRAQFSSEWTEFSGAQFSSVWTNFSRAQFDNEKTGFMVAQFSGQTTDFHEAEFSSVWTDFSEAQFSSEWTDFSEAQFDSTDFSGAQFSSKATHFHEAEFSGELSFLFAQFSSERTDFLEAQFSGERTDFSGAQFSGEETDFRRAQFSGERTDFQRVGFSSAYTSLEEVTFTDEVLFSGATFREHVVFSGTTENTVFDSDAWGSFDRCRIEKPEHLTFNTVLLHPGWFINTDVRKVDFTDVKWYGMPGGPEGTLDEEITALEMRGVESPYTLLAQACRRLSANAEDNHEYPLANDFHYWSMDALRKGNRHYRKATWDGLAWIRQNWIGVAKRCGLVPTLRLTWGRIRRRHQLRPRSFGLIATLYWMSSGYGVSPARASLMLFAMWLVFTALYFLVLESSPFWVFSASDIGQGIGFARQAAVYSLSALVRLNPSPQTEALNWFQTFVTIEGILGPLQIALLALATRRKVMR